MFAIPFFQPSQHKDYDKNEHSTNDVLDIVAVVLAIVFLMLVLVWLVWICCRLPWKRVFGRRSVNTSMRPRINKVSTKISHHDKQKIIDEDCSICLVSITDGLSVEMICKHKFHKQCIKAWIKTKKRSCPVCRSSFENARV